MRQGLVALVLPLVLGGSAAAPFVTPAAGAPICAKCRKDCCCSLKGPAGRCGMVGPCSPLSSRQTTPSPLTDREALPPRSAGVAPPQETDRHSDSGPAALVFDSSAPPDPPPRRSR